MGDLKADFSTANNHLVGGLEHGWIRTFQKQLGISSSQLDDHSMIFQRGRYTTNQPHIWMKTLRRAALGALEAN